jgi:hypothetical protein
VGTLMLLETLLGVINSRAANDNPNRAVYPPVVADQPAADDPMSGTQPSSETAPDPAYVQQQPGVAVAEQQAPRTEEDLRQQLDQVDLYDLSGEKAAAEALRRDDEFKQQQIDVKAEQTKEFFAEQDRKQQESLQEMQAQAAQRLEETRQKEFWDEKQSQEMRTGMESELRSLHEGARQEHLQWRADFTKGICRDDVAAVVNNQIEDRVGAYKDRLDDIGTNAVDAAETVEKYKVKLEDESKGQIEQQTAELHQEHFPEYQNIEPPTPDGPRLGEIPMKGFGPFEAGPQGGYGLEGLVNKDADFGPWEQASAPKPDKPFMRGEYDPRGDGTDAPEGWFKNVDELPKQDAPPGWFKNVDAPPADGKDVPDGFMKPIDPPLRDRISGAMDSAASATASAMDAAGEAMVAAKTAAGEAVERAKVAASDAIDATRLAVSDTVEAVKIAGPEAVKNATAQVKSQLADAIEGYKTTAASVIDEARDVAKVVVNSDTIHGALELADHHMEGMVVPGVPHDLAEGLGVPFDVAKEHGLDALKPAVKLEMEKASAFAQSVKEGAQDLQAAVIQRAKDLGQDIREATAKYTNRAEQVDQQMQPPAPAQKVDIPAPAPASTDPQLPPPTPQPSEIKPPS